MATTKKAKKAAPARDAKTRGGRKPKSAATFAETSAAPAGACLHGGDHQWEDTPDGPHCIRCHEPAEAPANSRPKQRSKTAPEAGDGDDKLSAIDSAAKVLAEAGEPLNAKQMIEAMAAKGYWTSPGGKTPHATLYSAILREITVRGDAARFKKTQRGHFAINN
jgi:hypothetical protein